MSKKEYPAKLTTGYYRVREVWEDEASQFGAYRLLANAKAKCDENPGSRVFDNDGNVIYPEEAVPDTYAFTAGRIYTVVPGDNLWKIAEKELGSGSRCADIRVLNGLTSNAIRVGMKLLIP